MSNAEEQENELVLQERSFNGSVFYVLIPKVNAPGECLQASGAANQDRGASATTKLKIVSVRYLVRNKEDR